MKKRKGEDGLPTEYHTKSVAEPKIAVSLAPLTDDKSLFRHWGGKLSNALAHLNKGDARALDAKKDGLDQGQDLEDELGLGVGAVDHGVDLEQFASDLSSILIYEITC